MAASEKYYYALGRRKTSSATVRLYEGEGKSTINGKDFDAQYSSAMFQQRINSPFVATDNVGRFYFSAQVQGGGVSGQIDAILLAVSRALVKFDENLKSPLKRLGLLTRDARMVERKKPGLRKARRAPQFSKR